MSRLDSGADLYRTALCPRGPGGRCGCSFAHSLAELRAPVEIERSYRHRWTNRCCDRFYGQAMSRRQLSRIGRYWDAEPICQRPVWAIGLFLIRMRQETFYGLALPWDFGLMRDREQLELFHFDRRCPFEGCHMDFLWIRLHRRYRVMLHLRYKSSLYYLPLALQRPESHQSSDAVLDVHDECSWDDGADSEQDG